MILTVVMKFNNLNLFVVCNCMEKWIKINFLVSCVCMSDLKVVLFEILKLYDLFEIGRIDFILIAKVSKLKKIRTCNELL